jgi:hypothetical protein
VIGVASRSRGSGSRGFRHCVLGQDRVLVSRVPKRLEDAVHLSIYMRPLARTLGVVSFDTAADVTTVTGAPIQSILSPTLSPTQIGPSYSIIERCL